MLTHSFFGFEHRGFFLLGKGFEPLTHALQASAGLCGRNDASKLPNLTRKLCKLTKPLAKTGENVRTGFAPSAGLFGPDVRELLQHPTAHFLFWNIIRNILKQHPVRELEVVRHRYLPFLVKSPHEIVGAPPAPVDPKPSEGSNPYTSLYSLRYAGDFISWPWA